MSDENTILIDGEALDAVVIQLETEPLIVVNGEEGELLVEGNA